MRYATKFAVSLIAPPLLMAVPLAICFLAEAINAPVRWLLVGSIALVAYGIGGVAAGLLIGRSAQSVDDLMYTRRDPSDAVSAALNDVVLWSVAYWVLLSGFIAAVGWLELLPTMLGAQYFAEAALIVASTAMAWSYWRGKRMLFLRVKSAPKLAYTGRMHSVAFKITLVFVGFFIVSVGAMVLLISSHIAEKLGEGVALETTKFAFILAAITSIIFAMATYFLARDVTAPMRALKKLAAQMAEGKLDDGHRIFSDDEVGDVARSFGKTTESLRGLIKKVGSSGTSIAEGVRLMTDGTETLLTGAQQQTALAEEGDTALGDIRKGAQSVLLATEKVADLTYDSAGRATELRASSAEVAKRMDELFQSVEKTSSSTAQIGTAAREMTMRTEDLSGISSDVLAFVAQMDATVEQITRTAQSTSDLARDTKESAAAGRRAVEETVEGIRVAQESTRRTAGAFDQLQKSLGKIDQILVFIDELTNRTNLLSLNAAIIAAQAGDNDFGFSVIADEVRQLADRTRSATKEIAVIIRNVQPITREALDALGEGVANVDHTVSLAANASESLDRILFGSERSLEMIRMISNSLQEQSRASHHLHELASRLTDAVTDIHRGTQGQAEATKWLTQESERVRDIALQVKRSSDEQLVAGGGIAEAMEHIATDIRLVRDRLERQLDHAEQVAAASLVTVSIAQKNNGIAEQFSEALQALIHSAREFELEVTRFRV